MRHQTSIIINVRVGESDRLAFQELDSKRIQNDGASEKTLMVGISPRLSHPCDYVHTVDYKACTDCLCACTRARMCVCSTHCELKVSRWLAW